MSKILIYSTLTQSNEYALWEKGGADLPMKQASVIIKGGANLANKHLVTPRGVVTEVSAEELALLRGNRVFQRHLERGFLTVDEGAKREETDKVVSDMVGRDMSAPLVPQDYELEGKKAPVTNIEGKKEGGKAPVQPKSIGKKAPSVPKVPTPPVA